MNSNKKCQRTPNDQGARVSDGWQCGSSPNKIAWDNQQRKVRHPMKNPTILSHPRGKQSYSKPWMLWNHRQLQLMLRSNNYTIVMRTSIFFLITVDGTSIKPALFVGCTPYAHGQLLGGVRAGVLKPTADIDFASLGFSWYHVIRKQIDWQLIGQQPFEKSNERTER